MNHYGTFFRPLCEIMCIIPRRAGPSSPGCWAPCGFPCVGLFLHLICNRKSWISRSRADFNDRSHDNCTCGPTRADEASAACGRCRGSASGSALHGPRTRNSGPRLPASVGEACVTLESQYEGCLNTLLVSQF